MPDSTGFGDYTETGQVIPVSFQGRKGGYTHCMFLNDDPPIAGGRELWGFPKKLAEPTLQTEIDTLVGTLDYGPVRVATGTMGYKHRAGRPGGGESVALRRPISCSRSSRTSMAARASASWSSTISRTSTLKGAWTGPAALSLSTARACAGRRVAGAGGCFRGPHHSRPDARAGEGRARFFEVTVAEHDALSIWSNR